MEHRHKRRKIEGRGHLKGHHHLIHATTEKLAESQPQEIAGVDVPKIVVSLDGEPQLEDNILKESPASTPLVKLELRQLLLDTNGKVINAVNHEAQPVESPAANTVNGVVANAQNAVSQVASALPSVSLQASLGASAGSASNPAPSGTPTTPTAQPVDDTPGETAPGAAVAAADARNQALAAEQARAEEDIRLPPPPGSSPLVNPASNSPTSQNAQAAQTAVGSSQQVLSSPSTPSSQSPAASSNTSPTSKPSLTTELSSSISPSSSSNLPASASPTSPTAITSRSGSSSNSTLTSSSSTLSSSPLSTSNSVSATTASSNSIIAISTSSRPTESASSELSISQTLQPSTDTALLSTTSTAPFSSPTTLLTTTSLPSSFSLSSAESSSESGSASATGTGGKGIVGGGNGIATNTAGSPSSTSTAGAGSGGGSNMPPARVLAGGIVGGVAGLMVVILALLLLLRWRRTRGAGQKRTISPPMPQTAGTTSAPQGSSGAMTQRSSTTPIAAGILNRLRPSSSQTATTSDTGPSERGFQKISGRKLPSVLTSGGDGYGDSTAAAGSSGGPSSGPQSRGVAPGQGPFAGLAPGLRPSPPHSLSGSSFYRDSKGFYGGVVPDNEHTDPSGSPTSSSPTYPVTAAGPLDRGSPSRKPTIRPGPARTPVINQPGILPTRNPSRAQAPPTRPPRSTPPPTGDGLRDGLGRSRPSQDGSRTSRFRESTTPP